MTSYIPDAVRHRVIEAFGNRCSYCLAAQRYVLSKLEIERIIPVTQDGSNDDVNLCLACRLCNLYKSDQIEAVDPVTKAIVAKLGAGGVASTKWREVNVSCHHSPKSRQACSISSMTK